MSPTNHGGSIVMLMCVSIHRRPAAIQIVEEFALRSAEGGEHRPTRKYGRRRPSGPCAITRIPDNRLDNESVSGAAIHSHAICSGGRRDTHRWHSYWPSEAPPNWMPKTELMFQIAAGKAGLIMICSPRLLFNASKREPETSSGSGKKRNNRDGQITTLLRRGPFGSMFDSND